MTRKLLYIIISAVLCVANARAYTVGVNISGGAEHLVSASPAVGASVSTGDRVTYTASENELVAFSNWEDGSTGLSHSVLCNGADVVAKATFVNKPFLAAWDFHELIDRDRKADISGNEANAGSILYMTNKLGDITNWLDKSDAKGGFNGEGCAINWHSLPSGDNNANYYFQAEVCAKGFSDIVVTQRMGYYYNAYLRQNVEWSLDGRNWAKAGTVEMGADWSWYDASFPLPSGADNAEKIYIRWIPDYSSAVGGQEGNDGTSLSWIAITGQPIVERDGKAPVLKASYPKANAKGASATGRIVLTFDEYVSLSDNYVARLGGNTLKGEVYGKSVVFRYSGLGAMETNTFSLSDGAITDLFGNAYNSATEITFTTEDPYAVQKRRFDFIVGVDGSWAEAKAAAEKSNKDRFYMFFPDGYYNFGGTTGDGNQMTTFKKANVSFIGQSMDGVVCYNKPSNEGISVTATINLDKASSGIYMQDITLKNDGTMPDGSSAARFVVLRDQGDKNIYKRVKMLSGQDTYYSPTGSRRSYHEECEIHGTVDFICGGGDVYFNKCLLFLENRGNNVITAPANDSPYGYVFESCTIDGYPINAGQYRLGRSWQKKASAVYLNTTMKVLPTAQGWGDPMNVVPTRFAEYNSRNQYGGAVDLSQRRSFYQCSKDGSTTTINPVLSVAEAANYTLENVVGGNDGWRPNELTKQIAARKVSAVGNRMMWEDDSRALCYFIFKDGKYLDNVAANSYTVQNVDLNAKYTVRAANAMGGLGEESNAVMLTNEIIPDTEHIFYYDNGATSKREGTENENVWSCTDSGYDEYSWEIVSRDDKSILYADRVMFRGNYYTTFKNSNGAQNKITMPEGYKATKVSFIGYTNDGSANAVLTEINGEEVSIEMAKNTSSADYSGMPAVVEYTFKEGEEPCKEFTFTFGVKQVCFIIALESEYCGCVWKNPARVEIVVANGEEGDGRVYDMMGREVREMKEGRVYVKNGAKVMRGK